MNVFFLFLALEVLVFAAPVKANPINSTPNIAPDASVNPVIKDKGNHVPENAPVGDFDSPRKRDSLQQPSSTKVTGKLMHAKDAKQTGENKNANLPIGKIISSPKPGAPLVKSYKQRKRTNGFTPRAGDFGPLPETGPTTKVVK